ncbi:hypothetical protein RJ639_007684 [Escallonia herrerae]|uniref:Protein TIC 22-like, chloroplastic n=1 Tax=Escallonia herrerae TaxID=1293975 RepID=A0AA88VV05_9ASTE|nr:hypothetical protein RJ639_007684 [Escallonia herrerae]
MRNSPTPQPQPPQFSLQEALTNFRNHFNPFSVKTHLESALKNLKNHAQNNLSASGSRGNNPIWARISEKYGSPPPSNLSMSTEAIEERLAGVPVYALSNSFEEFVLISGANTRKSIGLFCFKEEDAETLLAQMKSMDPDMRKGSRVVAVALNKMLPLNVGKPCSKVNSDITKGPKAIAAAGAALQSHLSSSFNFGKPACDMQEGDTDGLSRDFVS